MTLMAKGLYFLFLLTAAAYILAALIGYFGAPLYAGVYFVIPPAVAAVVLIKAAMVLRHDDLKGFKRPSAIILFALALIAIGFAVYWAWPLIDFADASDFGPLERRLQ
jgi:hypothetical protein